MKKVFLVGVWVFLVVACSCNREKKDHDEGKCKRCQEQSQDSNPKK